MRLILRKIRIYFTFIIIKNFIYIFKISTIDVKINTIINRNIFICRYDYNALKILAKTQRHLLTQLHKERSNGKENALSAIKFFDNPDVKNAITQMIVKHSATKSKIEKSIKSAQEALDITDEVSLNIDQFFSQIKVIGNE